MVRKNLFKRNRSSGVTMIEALVSIALVTMLTMSVYSVLAGVVKNIADSKQRTGALALANEKMEVFRNLPYSQIGTINGIVSGPVAAVEDISRNGFNYKVFCEVRYVDDAFDGFFPDDVVNTDYKRASVQVFWSNGGTEKKITLFDNFVPDGMETNVGGGTLSINTVGYSGQAVAGVTVQVSSVNNSPAVNFTSVTDNYGNLILPGVPSQNYRISLAKDGYENVSTYPNPPGSEFIPLDADIFVEEGKLNAKTFYINEAGNLTFATVKMEDDSPVEGLNLAVKGGKIIGISPETYSFDENLSLGSDGSKTLPMASPGEYWVENTNELETENYKYVGTSENYPITLSAGQTKVVSLIFANKNANSLVVVVNDSEMSYRLEGASVRLTGENFDQSILTTNEGFAYFPVTTDPITIMVPGTYHLEVTKDGYKKFSKEISIDKLIVENVNLEAN